MQSLMPQLPQNSHGLTTSNIEARRRLLNLLKEKQRRESQNQIATVFPETGPLRRELYPKHMAFFEASKQHKEILFLSANRVGKTVAGGYATSVHLTGEYPDWWPGHRFEQPITALAAGDTGNTTRDILQNKLLGKFGEEGSGLIPGARIAGLTRKMGIPEAYEEIKVKHVSGGISRLWLRSYEQGRKVFQGFEMDWIWLDEEVPQEVYDEALIRTMTTNGRVAMTYTPIMGMTPLTLSFIEDAQP